MAESKAEKRAKRRERKAAKKNRQAKALAQGAAAPAEAPKTLDDLGGDAQQINPLFCFKYAAHRSDEDAAFRPAPADATEVLDFCCEMARLTWAEIEAQRTGEHKRHHEQPIDSLKMPEARGHIADQELDAIFGDSIFRFRLSGERRLWGFRRERTFHALFWDPGHDIYPTEPD